MKEQTNVPLLIFLSVIGIGLLIAVGGFDDADVRDLENPQLLSERQYPLKKILKN